MARAYGDDLRRKFLAAHDRGGITLGELAERFGVSRGWAWKVSAARRRTGKAERAVNPTGRKLRAGPEAQSRVLAWFEAQSDLTVDQVQTMLGEQVGLALSRSRVWALIRRLGLRLKKSRSRQASGTRKPTASAAEASSKPSGRSRRKG